ncbi:MAG: DOMON domain-containing protein [Planctomycetota bacterium]
MATKRRTEKVLFFAVVLSLLILIGCQQEKAWKTEYSGKTGKELVVGKEGFWRLKQDGNGVWWFLSPEGKQEFLNTVTTVQPFQKGRDANGRHYVSRDYKGRTDVEIWNVDSTDLDKYLDEWAAKTVKRVKDAGFKALGGWCQPAFHRHDVAMSRCLSVWSWVGKGSKLFYEPDWPQAAEEIIKKQVVGLRNNTNLVGYYIDNELGWKDGFGSVDGYFDKLAADNPNRQEVMKVIRSMWPTIRSFNKDWQRQLKDWSEMDKWEKLPAQPAKTVAKLNDVWRYHLARDYIECATKLIRKHDSNHLILGMRFKGGVQREVCRAAKGLTDAMSINVYASDARLDKELMETIHKESEQPIIITEYAFHSIDGRSGDMNRCGFIWGHVIDQKAREDGYRMFTRRLARLPYIIGADWFQWNDEPPSGRGDGEDVNFGVVDINDELYEDLAKAIRQTTPVLNDLHSESFSDTQQDIWAKSGDKPAALNIPYLETTILLDGDLSDWPAENKAGDIKYVETVGIERAVELVVPRVCLGWRQDGLYVGMEVFDKDIDGYALNEETKKHSWRTRSFDCVELWFSTRPAIKQQNWYNQYCCDFMFIPAGDGMVVQWHHRGDALEADRIPHPDVKYFFKKSTEGYTVEMFIPAGVLNGFEPKTNTDMAGNIFVRNWQPRIDWYWACGEFGQPGKWGDMKLIK